MKKSLIYGIIWASWLGGWLGYLGYSLLTWQFWAVFVPVVIFTSLEKIEFKEGD